MRAKSFTLIHGTFAAKSKWLNQSAEENPSNFRALLRKKFSSPISFQIPKPWGGTSLKSITRDLSNEARLEGAQTIRSQIKNLPRDQDNFIIAHSHGGNVAMYALQDKEAQSNTAGLICLATPFLYPRPRPLSIASLAVSLIIMTIGFLQIVAAMNLLEGDWKAVSLALIGAIITVVIPSFLLLTIVSTRFKSNAEGNKSLVQHVQNLSYTSPNIPILLIKPSGDEASGLLRGIQFLNWLGGMAMFIGGRQLYALVCISALIAVWYFSPGQTIDQTLLLGGALSWLSSVMMSIAFIMVIMLMGLTVSRISVGWDAWKWVGEIETLVEDAPPGINATIQVLSPRRPALGRLNHTSLFTQEETLSAIHSWCEKISSARHH